MKTRLAILFTLSISLALGQVQLLRPALRLAWDNPNSAGERQYMVTEVQVRRTYTGPWQTFATVPPNVNTILAPRGVYSGYFRARFAITNQTPWRYSAYSRTLAVSLQPVRDTDTTDK